MGEFNELYAGNRTEHFSGLFKDAAVPTQVARIVKGDPGIDFLQGDPLILDQLFQHLTRMIQLEFRRIEVFPYMVA